MPVNRSVKLLTVNLLMLLFALAVSASMVQNMPYTATQPDGSRFDCFVSGDEYHNWLHDKDNFTIIRNPETGFFVYAEQDGDNVKASSLVVGIAPPQTRGLTPGINISESAYKQLRQTKFAVPETRDAPTTGTINNIVVYIRFSDETEFTDLSSLYNGWFNTGTSSLKNYFLEASYNQLTINTTFYPTTSTNYVVSWQSPNPRSYYQPYDASTNPNGYNGDTQRRTREHALLRDAVNGVSSQIPSSLVIDSDGDGRVDNVVFIVKGAAGAWSSLLWPHRWSLYTYYVYIHGKRVYDYNFQLQTFLSSRGVGVICHEFFHSLGAPDLYHYTDNGISPAGAWDLMNSDQNPPQHMTAYMKYKYGHWISSIPTISADGVYTLNPLTSSTGNAYRINSNNANQYYVVEFRKKTGTYENSVPGSGLLVYRIDTSAGDGNASGPPDELYIYRPNGTTTVNGTVNSANFSSEAGRIKIDNTTNPTPFLQDGTAGNLYLCEIGSSAGGTMSFRKGLPFINFSPNPYLQSFDATSFPPDGWINQAVSGSYVFERVTSGTNPSASPQSGAGMVKFNSDTSPSGSSALLATPRIDCSDISSYNYQVSFYMYREGSLSSILDKIEVYLNSSQNLSGTPTLLGTINRSRTQAPVVAINGWYQYTFNLPFAAVGSYYAVFKAISANGYNMYLDNIRVSRVPKPATNPFPADQFANGYNNQSFSWVSGGGNPTSYKFYLGTNNPPSNVVNGQVLGNVLSYTFSGNLDWQTQFYWMVVPSNEGGDVVNCPVWSFTTMADNRITGLPYLQQFDTVTAPELPGGWMPYVSSISTSAYVRTYSSATIYAYSVPNCLQLTNSSDANADLRLVSPEITVPMNILRLRFYARGSSDGYTLQVGTMNSYTGVFSPLETISLTNVLQQYTVSLAVYGGTNRFIALKHGLGGTSRSIYIDDFRLEERLSNDLMISGISTTGVALANQALEFQIGVTNNGVQTQNQYTIKLMAVTTRLELASLEVNTPLAAGETANHTLAWTPSTEQSLDVYALLVLSTDSYPANNASEPTPVTICTYIPEVGNLPTALTTNLVPLNFFYKNSISETIYLASDLQMTAGNLSAMVYQSNFTQNLPNQPVKIWMKNTSETNLSSGWLPYSGYTLVFDGVLSFTTGSNSVAIPFIQPFAYTGSNLAIRVNRPMDSVYYSSSNYFYYQADSQIPNRSRYIRSDSVVYDPTNLTEAGTATSYIPVTLFAVDNYVPLVLATPQVNISLSDTEATLTWTAVQGANAYQIFATENPFTWQDTPLASVSQNSYLYSGNATRMFFKIKAVYLPR